MSEATNELKSAFFRAIWRFIEMRYVTQNIAQMMRYGNMLRKFIHFV